MKRSFSFDKKGFIFKITEKICKAGTLILKRGVARRVGVEKGNGGQSTLETPFTKIKLIKFVVQIIKFGHYRSNHILVNDVEKYV